jgi:hypothetical protein
MRSFSRPIFVPAVSTVTRVAEEAAMKMVGAHDKLVLGKPV